MAILTENVEKSAIVTKIIPETTSFDPRPVLVPDILPQYHQDLHLRCKGTLAPVNIYDFRDCVVGPNGVIISKDKDLLGPPDINGSKWTQDRLEETIKNWSESDPLIRALSGKSEVISYESDDPVLVLNRPGCLVYGHWLLDILPMLFVFFHENSVPDIDNSKLKVLLPQGTPSWAMSFMAMLFDIPAERIIVYCQQTSVFKAPRLLVASQMRYSDFCSPAMNSYVDFIKSRALPHASREALPERIFITRKGVNSFIPRAVHNEQAMITLAARFGVQAIDPTKLSWPDQIRLFSEAKLICGPFGSGLHNSIFSDEKAICFSLGSSRMNWIQSGLSALRRQNMAYLLPIHEDFRDGRNLMIYDTERFCHGLGCLLDSPTQPSLPTMGRKI